MYATKIGALDGTSWEQLCQQVFKRKFAADGYQQIPTSPGDFGLEGFCKANGKAFQCYCPEKQYSQTDLYSRQVAKITTDLGKLQLAKNSVELQLRLGDTKIRQWCFVTPDISHNKLLAHAQKKEAEVKGWNLPYIAADFSVELHDLDFYLVEIHELTTAQGLPLTLGTPPPLALSPDGGEDFDKNILRKSEARLAGKASHPGYKGNVDQLVNVTTKNFLESDEFYRQLEREAPAVYLRVALLIDEYARRVEEDSITWTGTPEALTTQIKTDLEARLVSLGHEVGTVNAQKLARLTVARWLAVCTLDYGTDQGA
ncbi:hypothetical protein [Xanthomonas citri]